MSGFGITNKPNAIGGAEWFYLQGNNAEMRAFNAEFASKVHEGYIPQCFRSHNIENNMLASMRRGENFHVGVINFTKAKGLFNREGAVGFMNDSSMGYGTGDLFLNMAKATIEEYFAKRGIRVAVEKEGVSLIIEVSGGEIPASFEKDIIRELNNHESKFNYTDPRTGKQRNALRELIGQAKLGMDFGYTTISASLDVLADEFLNAAKRIFEKVKFEGFRGAVSYESLKAELPQVEGRLAADLVLENLNEADVARDYVKHSSLFRAALTTLPKNYERTLKTALTKGFISESTYRTLRAISRNKFIDSKFECLNERGISLVRHESRKEPLLVSSAIAVMLADELGGQVRIGDKAYNFSLDINNLSGINREYGADVGDQFLRAHIEAFDEVTVMIERGEITDIKDVFVKYYELINAREVVITKGTASRSVRIGMLSREYAKIEGRVDAGASGVVVCEEISRSNVRNVERLTRALEDEVKNLKTQFEECKKGHLVIEIRSFVRKNGKVEINVRTITQDIKSGKKAVTQEHFERRNRVFEQIVNNQGRKVAAVVQQSFRHLTASNLASLDRKLATGVATLSAEQLAKEFKIDITDARRIVEAANSHANRMAGGQYLSLVVGLVGMEVAGMMIQKFAPDVNPVFSFMSMCFVGHNLNTAGSALTQAVLSKKLPLRMLDLSGGIKAMNPVNMGGGLVASAVFNILMDAAKVSNDSKLRSHGGLAAFMSYDAALITEKFLLKKYGFALLGGKVLKAGGKVVGAAAVTTAAFGIAGAGWQQWKLGKYEASVVSRAFTQWEEVQGGWASPSTFMLKLVGTLGADGFTAPVIVADEGRYFYDKVVSDDREYSDQIIGSLRGAFGYQLALGLRVYSTGELNTARLTPENIEIGRRAVKDGLIALITNAKSSEAFANWQAFLKLYSSGNFVDVPAELLNLNPAKIGTYVPSETVVKWAVRTGII